MKQPAAPRSFAALMDEALAGADVVYATRIQKERFAHDEVLEGFDQAFAIDRALVDAACRKDVVLMHPLPRDGRPGSHDSAGAAGPRMRLIAHAT